jgi:(p)ppGpp synthase/HD superfamily hydrolase
MTTKSGSSFDRKFIPLTTRFDHALLFAAQVHRDQDRTKSGIPYLSHLLGVASIVMDYGGDEEMAIAALLHDAVEDHGGRPMLQVLGPVFGPRVAKSVDGCTDSYVEDPQTKEPWEKRKVRYLHRVRHEDAETRFVSAADKLYNVRAVLRDLRYDGDIAFAIVTQDTGGGDGGPVNGPIVAKFLDALGSRVSSTDPNHLGSR